MINLLLATQPFITEDDNYNIFKFDTSLTAEDKSVVLGSRRDDTTPWDYLTDWGDGVIDNTTSHAYTNDGIYVVKTKYILDESNNRDNNTRKKLVDCININKNMTDLSNMFSWCINVTEFTNSNNWDTSNITNMGSMFNGCNKLSTLDVSKFNTNKVKYMDWMFNNCNNLTTLNVINFNTSNVTNMSGMFNNCNSLTTLDVSNFNTSNVTRMDNIFKNCASLTTLDVSNFNTSNVTNMGSMFNNCNKLTTLDISNFNMDNVTTYENMFTNCISLHQSGLTMTNCNEATKTKINDIVPA